jgi:hypothetical protein
MTDNDLYGGLIRLHVFHHAGAESDQDDDHCACAFFH